MNLSLKVTIISDLHCKHTSSDKGPKGKLLHSTTLYSDILRTDAPPKHPIFSLLQLINSDTSESEFESDLLICPGDITDKIDNQGFISGWSFLEEIRDAIGAQEIYATIGNHDVDSRRTTPKSKPFTVAQAIKSNFPITDHKAQQEFWLDNFCVIETDSYVVLNFNSSHSHLSYDDAGKSYIDAPTLNKMETKLKKIGGNKVKIALCHHHPINQSNLNTPDTDVIDKGTDFLDLLCKYDFDILIHGHKHEIKLRYYNSLVVFCAGSFSSQENLKETESDNAFHILELYPNKKGIIKTWYYGSQSGWHKKSSLKFPTLSGFGFKGDIKEIAAKINAWLKNESNGKNDLYQNLIRRVEDVQFLLPEQMAKLKSILADQYHIDLTYDDFGTPKQITQIAF